MTSFICLKPRGKSSLAMFLELPLLVFDKCLLPVIWKWTPDWVKNGRQKMWMFWMNAMGLTGHLKQTSYFLNCPFCLLGFPFPLTLDFFIGYPSQNERKRIFARNRKIWNTANYSHLHMHLPFWWLCICSGKHANVRLASRPEYTAFLSTGINGTPGHVWHAHTQK